MAAFAERYAHGPTRTQFQNKDPRGFAEFKRNLMEHDALGSANTQLGVQRERPSLYDLTGEMERLTVPTLLMTGDEDWPCLAPVLLLKRHIATAGLVVLPNSGHTINLEEPDAFNQALATFLAMVDGGRWPVRDRKTSSPSSQG